MLTLLLLACGDKKERADGVGGVAACAPAHGGGAGGSAGAETPSAVIWRFGGPGHDRAFAVDVDADGDAYVAILSDGDFGEPVTTGHPDNFVRKYDAGGNVRWTLPLADLVVIRALAVEPGGDFYLAEERVASDGVPGQKKYDVRKFDRDGTLLWSRESSTNPTAMTLNARGDLFVVGYQRPLAASDPPSFFLSRYAPDGALTWTTERFGSIALEEVVDVAADETGEVYVASAYNGWTSGAGAAQVQRPTVYRYEFDTSGILTSTQALGTPDDSSLQAVSVDAKENVYALGNGRDGTQVLGKYGPDAVLLWKHTFDSAEGDQFARFPFVYRAVSVDRESNVYLRGFRDTGAVIRKYDSCGTLRWRKESWLGPDESIFISALAVAPGGSVYAAGGVLPLDGDADALLMKLDL